MSLRKIILLCVLVTTVALPLVGCGGPPGRPAGGAASDGPARPSSHTTAE